MNTFTDMPGRKSGTPSLGEVFSRGGKQLQPHNSMGWLVGFQRYWSRFYATCLLSLVPPLYAEI
jgi:hypothetical protein